MRRQVDLGLCLRVGMGQRFPQSWLWQVLERSQRSWGFPKWCYLKAQLFLQLLGAWGTLEVACTELGFASVPKYTCPRGGATLLRALRTHQWKAPLTLGSQQQWWLCLWSQYWWLLPGSGKGLVPLGSLFTHTFGPLLPTPPPHRRLLFASLPRWSA